MMNGGGWLREGGLGGFAAEEIKDGGGDHEVEQGAADEAADDDDGDGMEDFFAGFIGSKQQWHEGDAGAEGRHEDGDKAFQRAAHDHGATESFAFMLHEMEVVRDHHDAVAGGDSADGDEADEGGDADVIDEQPGEGESTHECQWDV